MLGTGIGGGIVLNGKVWMGCSGGAGELSGLLVDFNAMGLPFPQSMSALWANRISAASITKAYAERKGLESADGIMLFDAYEAGDEDAKAVLDHYAKWAASGIVNMQSVLDLQRYAIGGGISARPEATELIAQGVDRIFELRQGLPFWQARDCDLQVWQRGQPHRCAGLPPREAAGRLPQLIDRAGW